jgi:CheY-like chemotaxis protein
MRGALGAKQGPGHGLAIRRAQGLVAALAIYAIVMALALSLLAARGPLPHRLIALWLAMSLLGPAAAAILGLRQDAESVRGFGAAYVAEPAQMVVRLFLPGIILGYLLSLAAAGVAPARLLPLIALDIATTLYGWMLLAHLLLKPRPSPLRRWVAMLSDVGLLSIFLHFGGALSVPWFSLYFWIVLGFGLTPRALAAAAAATLFGFAAVYAATPYWQERPGLAAGIALALILLPAHLANLLRRLAPEPAADGSAEQDAPRRPLPPRAPSRRGLDILVADGGDAQRSLRQMLEAGGHRITVAGSVGDAFFAVEGRRFDLLLIGDRLECVSGAEMARLYRLEHLGEPRLPIVAISPDAAGETEARWHDAGIDRVVPKPVAAPALLAAIDDTVARLAKPAAAPPSRWPAPVRRSDDRAAVLDEGVIAALRELGGDEFLNEVAETFRGEGRRRLEELRRSIHDGDPAGFARLVDAFYGAAINVGGTRLCQALTILRGIGAGDLREHGNHYLATLHREFDRIEAALGSSGGTPSRA